MHDADLDEVCTYDDLSVTTSSGNHVVLRCPSCGVLPVPQRETTLSDLTNASLEHLQDHHLNALVRALGAPAVSLASSPVGSRSNRATSSFGVDEFWSLIALLGPHGAAGDVEALARGLAALEVDGIQAFDQLLVAAVDALDTPGHARQDVFDVDNPLPGLAQGTAVTSFYARVAAVAAGRDVYSSVLADPDELAGAWPIRAAQVVLDAAPAALRRVTGRSDSFRTPVPRPGWAADRDSRNHAVAVEKERV